MGFFLSKITRFNCRVGQGIEILETSAEYWKPSQCSLESCIVMKVIWKMVVQNEAMVFWGFFKFILLKYS